MKTNLGLELILQAVGANLCNTGDRRSDINYRKLADQAKHPAFRAICRVGGKHMHTAS
jgi:hypothetical protein